MTRSERHALYVNEAAKQHGVDPAAIMRPHGRQSVRNARRQVIRRYHEAGFSISHIARVMQRHHTTILDALGRGQ